MLRVKICGSKLMSSNNLEELKNVWGRIVLWSKYLVGQFFWAVNIFVGSKILESPNFDPLNKLKPKENVVGLKVFLGGSKCFWGQNLC